MSHIFISYSKQDIEFARHLRHLLQDEGFAVWMDESRLASSQKWWPTIESNIKTCDAFIIIMSPASKGSNWVEREILVAEKAEKPIFPVLYAGEAWSRLAEIQYEGMTAGVNADLSARFVGQLKDVVTISGSRKAPPQLPGEQIPDDSHPPADLNNQQASAHGQKNLLKRLNEPWAIIIAAVIGGIFLLAGALIQRANEAANTPTPDLTATHAITQTALAALPTVTDLTDTSTATEEPNLTATEAMIQQTVVARETENAQLLAQNTQIAAQNQTAAAPTATDFPTSTNTPTTTPTQTSAPPTATSRPTDTPAPSGDSIPLTIYRDEDSFTLYVPQSSEQVSLVGLEFRVGISGGEQIIRRLDTDFSGFLGIPFNNISSLGAVCFRLVRADRANPVPQVCQNSVLLLTQQLANADVFWRDGIAGIDRTVLVYRDDALIGACGTESSCVVSWQGANDSAMVAVTPTPGYPCEATIQSSGRASLLNIVRRGPSDEAMIVGSVQVGQIVRVVNRQPTGVTNWYSIENDEGRELGWIVSDYLRLSEKCPDTLE